MTRQHEPNETLPIELYEEDHYLEKALGFPGKEIVELKRRSKRGKGMEKFQGSRDLDLDLDVDQTNSSTDAKSKELLEIYIGQ